MLICICFCNFLKTSSIRKRQSVASSRVKKDDFQKNCLHHSMLLLQQSSDKRDVQMFCHFGYKNIIEKFQIYQKKRAFHLNKANCTLEVGCIRIRSYNAWKNINILPVK